MSLWTQTWYAPVERHRSVVLVRGTLAVLALDAWRVMLPHGGRYGAGDFNVAHFDWLDRVAPLPSPELYVGLMVVVGALAMLQAIAGPSPLTMAVLCGLYTYSWALSFQDSYQHHYLLSWVLFGFTIIAGGGAWAFRLIAALLSLMYGFAAISKTDDAWLSGEALRAMGGAGLGSGLLPVVTVGLELLLAAAFFASVWRAPGSSRVASWVWTALWVGAVAFHLLIGQLAIQIGWFGVYCVWFATAFFSPVTRFFSSVGERSLEHCRLSTSLSLGATGVVVFLLGGWAVNLPGALAAERSARR